MSGADRQRKGEPPEDFFKWTGRFADLMLLEWQAIEVQVNQALDNVLSKANDKTLRRIKCLDIAPKIDYLYSLGILDDDDFETMTRFRKFRNKLVHGDVYYRNLSEKERDEIVENALQARDVLPDRVWNAGLKRNKGLRRNQKEPKLNTEKESR